MNFGIDQIKGVIPATITCFDDNENFDERKQRGFISHLLAKGVKGLYLTGSTGDSFLMTIEERKRVVEACINAVAGKIPVIVHVGAIGTKLTEELAIHAYDSGADAVSSVPPFYWAFNDESIFEYYKQVTEVAPIPMIMYNFQNAGLVSYEAICKITLIDGVKGIKYTASDHYKLPLLRSAVKKDLAVFSGMDEMALSGLISGACGIIGSFYNLMPEIYLALYDAVIQGDLDKAKEKQKLANVIISEVTKYDYIPMIKALLNLNGIDVGRSKRPFTVYTNEEAQSLKLKLKKLLGDDAKEIQFLK